MKIRMSFAALLLLQTTAVFADTNVPEKPVANDALIIANVGGKCGFVDAKGKLVIPAIYDSVSPFYADGLASVSGGNYGTSYFIDRSGKKVFAVPDGTWDSDWARDDEFIQVDNGTKTGFIDRTGKIVVALNWDEASGFAGHRLAPVKLKGSWGYINRKGETVVPIMFSSAGSFLNGKAEVTLQGHSYSLSEDGSLTPVKTKAALSESYKFARDVGIGELYFVSDPNMAGLSTANVKTLGEPPMVLTDTAGKPIGRQFTYIALDDDAALFPAQQGNKYAEPPTVERHGYINTKGEIALPFIYESARGFNGGETAIVSIKGKWGMIDRKGKWVIKPKFDRLGDCREPTVRMTR